MSQDYVRIFDTTLRDGEQSPGATLTSAEKLEVAAGWHAWAWMSLKPVFPPLRLMTWRLCAVLP